LPLNAAPFTRPFADALESCALALPVLSVPSCDAEVVTAAPLAVKTAV
jgi:hypothetical protein